MDDENHQDASNRTVRRVTAPAAEIIFEPPPTITHHRQRMFLVAFARLGSVAGSCAVAGIGRRTYYNWRKKNPAFIAALALGSSVYGERLCSEVDGSAQTWMKDFDQKRDLQRRRRISDRALRNLLKLTPVEATGELLITLRRAILDVPFRMVCQVDRRMADRLLRSALAGAALGWRKLDAMTAAEQIAEASSSASPNERDKGIARGPTDPPGS